VSYRKAEEFLPIELIELIQNYVDGATIYIPRKENQRKDWGDKTTIRQELENRNSKIIMDYHNNLSSHDLAAKYYLSIKSIQRIIREMKYNR
jgi:Mor family transcriptional regulator